MKKSILLDLFIKQLNHHLVMSSEYKIGHIDVKRIKLEDNHEKITSLNATCMNSVVDCFKNKCLKFFTKDLDDENRYADDTFSYTGEKILIVF